MGIGLLCGDAVGRVGCLLNGCDYGFPIPPSIEVFGLHYGPQTAAYLSYPSPPGAAADVTPALWPVPIVEGLGSLALATFSRRGAWIPALVLWPAMRLALEFLRGDARAVSWGMTNTALVAGASLIIGLLAVALRASARAHRSV